MNSKKKPVTILMAEDDDDDFAMTQEALREAHVLNGLRRARDGQELMDYLCHRNAFQDVKSSPMPGLILLDLNMPKKDGRECLHEIKTHPDLKMIPVVVLTTSRAEEDILRSYQLGVNSFVEKPVTFEGLLVVMKELGRYWLEIVELPARVPAAR